MSKRDKYHKGAKVEDGPMLSPTTGAPVHLDNLIGADDFQRIMKSKFGMEAVRKAVVRDIRALLTEVFTVTSGDIIQPIATDFLREECRRVMRQGWGPSNETLADHIRAAVEVEARRLVAERLEVSVNVGATLRSGQG